MATSTKTDGKLCQITLHYDHAFTEFSCRAPDKYRGFSITLYDLRQQFELSFEDICRSEKIWVEIYDTPGEDRVRIHCTDSTGWWRSERNTLFTCRCDCIFNELSPQRDPLYLKVWYPIG